MTDIDAPSRFPHPNQDKPELKKLISRKVAEAPSLFLCLFFPLRLYVFA